MTAAELATAFLALGALGGCAAAAPSGDPAGVAIKLERGVCFGFCPAYAVTISGDGAVTYQGERCVAVKGAQTARVEPAKVAALAERFRQANFFSLKDEYRAGVTDIPTQTLSMTEGGKTKTLVDYGGRAVGMPEVIKDLEAAVDELAGTAKWVGEPSPELCRS